MRIEDLLRLIVSRNALYLIIGVLAVIVVAFGIYFTARSVTFIPFSVA